MAFSKEKKLCFWLTMLNLKPLFHVSCSSKTSLSLSLSFSLSLSLSLSYFLSGIWFNNHLGDGRYDTYSGTFSILNMGNYEFLF